MSSSRQMMMAWKVSGLSQRPAIIVSRPASMRLAIAISPSRDSSSTEPISRRYMRTGSSVRSVGSFLAGGGRNGGAGLLGQLVGVFLGVGGRDRRLGLFADLLVLDDVDAHVGKHRHGVLDLLGGHLLRRQHRIQFVHGDIAALLGGLDHLLDRIIGKVEQRAVGGAFTFGLGLFLFFSPCFSCLQAAGCRKSRQGIGRRARHCLRHRRLTKGARGGLPSFRLTLRRPAGSPSVPRNSAPSR